MNTENALNYLMDFKLAEHKAGKDDHVSYYVRDPETGKLVRKKIRLNSIDARERKKYARVLVHNINTKLYAGWNPLRKDHSTKATKLLQAIIMWRNIKIKEVRKNSQRSYNSISDQFIRWIENAKLDVDVEGFKSDYAKRYIAELSARRKLRTCNAHLGCIKAMFHWMVENEFCSENPFAKIKKRKPEEKTRQVIDANTRTEIDKWMEANNPQLRLVASLVFYCLIRPNELSYLKLQNFDFKNQSVWISPEASKNKKGDRVAIPNTAIKSIQKQLEKLNLNENQFVFSDRKTLAPGRTRIDSRYFAKHWNLMKKELGFIDAYQLYSLKDTGIVQMLSDGVPPNEVMLQARHSDLKTTSEYLKHVPNSNSHHFVKTKTTSLSGG